MDDLSQDLIEEDFNLDDLNEEDENKNNTENNNNQDNINENSQNEKISSNKVDENIENIGENENISSNINDKEEKEDDYLNLPILEEFLEYGNENKVIQYQEEQKEFMNDKESLINDIKNEEIEEINDEEKKEEKKEEKNGEIEEIDDLDIKSKKENEEIKEEKEEIKENMKEEIKEKEEEKKSNNEEIEENYDFDEYKEEDESNKNKNDIEKVDIKEENIHIPEGTGDLEKNCEEYNRLLENVTIDIQLLGIGSNGHIGFNEPGTPFDSITHVVDLNESTIRDNARFFDNDVSKVPSQAITMGISDVMNARKVLLLASGSNKANAIQTTVMGVITENVPASVLKNHPDVVIIIDKDAASTLYKEKR